MSLEEDLKAKALALISQQMANWVVDVQRIIGNHQEQLVRSLDEIQEAVARYDEKINEHEVESGIAEVIAAQGGAIGGGGGAGGGGMDRLKLSLGNVEKGTNLSEVLTYLVNEVSQYVERSAIFIIKGTNAIGWYARGFQNNDSVKQISIPLTADTVFRNIQHSRRAMRGHSSHSPGTAQALSRLGGDPQGILAVPLVLRDKLAAILYCDTSYDEVGEGEADLIEILVLFAGKTIDILSALPKTPGGPPSARGSGGISAEKAAAIRAGGDEIRERAGIPARPAPAVVAPAPHADEGSSTIMFNASTLSGLKAATAPAPAPARAAAPAAALSADEQKLHEDAKRFARLVVSEIKLYNEAKVNEGRKHRDIYERLKEDIERGRQMYSDRVNPQVRDSTNYFHDELIRILAGGDANALGPV